MLNTRFKNPLLTAFLEEQEHLELYEQYIKTPSNWLKKLIDQRFIKFYVRIRAISYFSKLIYFTARQYDKERRKYENRFALILDHHHDGMKADGSNTLKELIVDESASSVLNNYFNIELEQYFQHPLLFKAIKSLNKRQQQIIYLAYVINFSDTEISKSLNVSQQAISKSKNNALAKVRRMINA